MFGASNKSNSKTAPSVSTLRAQSSIYGVVLPVLRGTNRVPGKLIDWADFVAIPHTSQQASGGKGFGGSRNTETTNYTYAAAVDIALAMSQCSRIGTIWDSRGSYGNGKAMETFSVPSGYPGSYTPARVSEYSYDCGVSLVSQVEVWVPAWDPDTGLPQSGGQPGVGNGYWDTRTVYTPMTRVGGTPSASGQYQITGSGKDTKYNFNVGDAGKQARLTYGLTTNLADELQFFSGGRPQNSWAYMQSRYPTRALAYAGTCHIASGYFDLGSSGALDNMSFELFGPGAFGGGIVDAGFDECVRLVTIDPDGGCGWDPAALGDLNPALSYTAASGLFFSPLLDTQQTAATFLQDLCAAANVAPFWSEGKLKFVPYGDMPVAGNGYIYVPDLTPQYDLTDDDFLASDDEPAITIERVDPETLSNIIEIDINDRALGYNPHPIKDRDPALVARFGPIAVSPRKCNFICDAEVGARVANHLRLRATQVEPLKVRFRLGTQYDLLEPMDIVTLTVAEQGWVKKPFRLKEGDEDPETGATEWTAEPVVWGACTATLSPKQSIGGSSQQRDAAPGSVIAPIMFEAPDALCAADEYELWMGICGSLDTWGGCNVHASADGSTYRRVDGVFGASRMGVLQAPLPAVTGRDQTSTLDVDLTESKGELHSGTDDDRDTYRTLCYVEAANGQYELISYKTATLVGTNRYHLTDMRRGVYGTPVLAHAAGARFLRIDDAVTKLTFSPTDIDKTAYFKFTSFNLVGLAEEDIAEVSAYSYGVQGLYNNFSQIVSNDAVVESALESGNATAVVRAHKSGGAFTDAMTLGKSDGAKRTVAAVSYSGMSLSTWYWVMYNPATNACYVATSVSQRDTAVRWGHICLGSTQTPASNGSGGYTGGGGGAGGGSAGGGSYCPATEMLVNDSTRAADVKAGTELDCIEPLDGTRYSYPARRSTLAPQQPCVRLVADSGASLVVSASTPFTLPSGESCDAPYMLGKAVWVDSGQGTPAHLQTIVRVEDAGLRDVMAIDLGGRTFAAGEAPTGRIYSHNVNKPVLELESPS